MMSTMPQPVWNLETENVFSGFRKLIRGRLVWLVMPRFSLVSSLVSTQELLVSGRGKLPRVAPGGDTHADTLGRIENRAAANGEDEVDPLALAQGNALAHHGYLGVGRNAAQLDEGKPGVKQAFLDPVEQAGGAGARAAEIDQDAVCADLLELWTDLLLNVAAENDLGCRVDGKIQHARPALPVKIESCKHIIPAHLKKVKKFGRI